MNHLFRSSRAVAALLGAATALSCCSRRTLDTRPDFEPSRAPPSELREATPSPRRPALRELLDRCLASDVSARTAHARGDHAAARALRRDADALRVRLAHSAPAPGRAALTELLRARGDDAVARRRLCQEIVANELHARWLDRGRRTSRAMLDDLTRAILAAIPHDDDAVTAALGELLHAQPYLGLEHGPEVHRVSIAAAGDAGLRAVAARLIVTRWRNLLAAGARSRTAIAALALAWKDGEDRTRRRAALCWLATASRGRYRAVVAEELRRWPDPELEREIEDAAAAASGTR